MAYPTAQFATGPISKVKSVVPPPRKSLGSSFGSVPVVRPAPTVGITAPAPQPFTGPQGPFTQTTTMTPNQVYQSDILSDPGSVAAQGMFDAQSSNLAAARADAIQRAIINSGWTPSMGGGLASYAGDVTPETLAAAAANPMSQKAQLDLQLQQANQNLPYDLAASGAGRSGANAIQQSGLQRQYQTSAFQGQQNLLDSLYGAASNYAGNYNNLLSQLQAARESVANRLAQMAGYSQSITTDGGGGYGAPLDYGYGAPPDPGAPAPAAGSNQLSPSAGFAPTVSEKVQQVIKALGAGAKKSPYYGQNLKNILAG